MSCTPVSVTACAALQFPDVNVSVVDADPAAPPVDTKHTPGAPLVAVTVTSAVGALASATRNAAVPFSASVAFGSAACRPVSASPAMSSSVSVSAAVAVLLDTPSADGLLTDAVTCPVRAGLFSIRSSTARIVTRSALVVALAAIVIVLLPTTVYRPLTAAMVTVVAAVDALSSDADTVAVPPFSAIALLDSVSDAVGASSSAFVPDTVTFIKAL